MTGVSSPRSKSPITWLLLKGDQIAPNWSLTVEAAAEGVEFGGEAGDIKANFVGRGSWICVGSEHAKNRPDGLKPQDWKMGPLERTEPSTGFFVTPSASERTLFLAAKMAGSSLGHISCPEQLLSL